MEFRALGARDLHGPEGRRIDSLLSQPKRVALLAYLAAARPHGLHSRDRLAALFSPEADQPHARQALRQALSVLRSELGDGSIVAVGDGEVGLDSSAVWCDVVAFDEAVVAGRHAEALDLYRGDFLEGFFLPGAPEFEQWVENERARFKRDASACARALMDQCEAHGDLTAAAIWARRARRLVPEDEVLLRRLIRLLDLAGDRAGAVRVYEEFAVWLKREYEVEPAPETQALNKTIRERDKPTGSGADKVPEPAPKPPVPPAPKPPPPLPPGVFAAGVLLLAVGLVLRLLPVGPSCVRIAPFTVEDASTPPWLGDSLGHRVAQQLTGFPDFVTKAPGNLCPWRSSVARQATGTVRTDRGQLLVEVRLGGEPSIAARGTVEDWKTLGDAVAGQLVLQVLRSPLDSTLPAAVLPRTPEGRTAFVAAEKLFAEGRWTEAGQQYGQAESVDSTCYLCSWRIAEIGRWRRADTEGPPSYLTHVDLFPESYQSLIRAAHAPLHERFDTLIAATRKWRYFFLGWFELGDELFHRGPLVGRARREAIGALGEAVKVRPDFAPAWEHLAWALALDGDSAGAYAALDSLNRLRHPRDPNSLAIHALVTLGLTWRFAPRVQAEAVTKGALSDPRVWLFPDLSAGPRYLPTFGSPRGAVEVGRFFLQLAQDRARPDFIPSAMLAQSFGYVALGQPDSARRAAGELADRALTPELGLFAQELDAALLVLDANTGALRERWPELAKELSQFAETRSAGEGVQRRAAWAFTLAARRVPGSEDRYGALLDHEPQPQPLRHLLIADAHALSGRYKEALQASDALTELWADSLAAREPVAPFFRATLHLLRADWFLRLGNPQGARAELLWHQNLDEERGWLTRDPQVGEADWAFGTLAQWRLARLLDLAGDQRGAACRAYGEVVRLWSGGEPAYKARADTARARQAALGCMASS